MNAMNAEITQRFKQAEELDTPEVLEEIEDIRHVESAEICGEEIHVRFKLYMPVWMTSIMHTAGYQYGRASLRTGKGLLVVFDPIA